MRKRGIGILVVLFMLPVGLPATASGADQEWIVVLNPTNRPVPDVATEVANAHRGRVGFVYTTALQGFTLTLPANAVAGLSRNPNVAYIEPMRIVEAVGGKDDAQGGAHLGDERERAKHPGRAPAGAAGALHCEDVFRPLNTRLPSSRRATEWS